MTLNEKMKELRLQSGMTMSKVAREAHLSEAAVCRYEKGTRKVPLSYIYYWVKKGCFDLNDVTKYVLEDKQK